MKFALAVAVFLLLVAAGGFLYERGQVTVLNRMMAEAEADVTGLQQEVDDQSDTINSLQSRLAEQEQNIASLRQQLDQAKTVIGDYIPVNLISNKSFDLAAGKEVMVTWIDTTRPGYFKITGTSTQGGGKIVMGGNGWEVGTKIDLYIPAGPGEKPVFFTALKDTTVVLTVVFYSQKN